MKNIKTKIWALLGTTIMLLPFVLSLGTADVSAAVSPTPENVTVNLHKLKFTSAPENQINNGTELTFPILLAMFHRVNFGVLSLYGETDFRGVA